jgi:uncharacterized protein
MPLFPLGSVLFPCGRLPLQIFERRYLDLVRDCLKNDTGFGMAWIVRGQEVAQPGVGLPNLGEFGTYARIVDWDSLPNGLLGVTIEGQDIIRIHECHARADQLVVGNVEILEPAASAPILEEWDSMLDVLSSLEVHPHVLSLGLNIDRTDAWQVGRTLAQLLPVEEPLKYELLQIDEVAPFMERLDQLLNMLGGMDA